MGYRVVTDREAEPSCRGSSESNPHCIFDLTEAMALHGGAYADDPIASLFRMRICQDPADDVQVPQNLWNETAGREETSTLFETISLSI
jgi:hypothetical protein